MQLRAGQNVIGRKCGELSVEDPTVSRRHCVIEVAPSRSGSGWDYLLCDIGATEGTASTNGVFVNGRRVQREVLHDGDVVAFGRARFRFHTRGPGMPDG